jgi:uncharacterized protein
MKVWIDLDNSPHVLFFAPMIRDLERRGIEVLLTARKCAQTEELALRYGLKFTLIGRHYESRSLVVKIGSALIRACALLWFVLGKGVGSAVSHGSRAMVIAASILRIPVMTIYDYEFASYRLYNILSDRILAPSLIPIERLLHEGLNPKKLVPYPGLKEEVYVYDFQPDESVDKEIGRDPARKLITVRPPSTWAHYHNDQSEVLFEALLSRLAREPDAQVVVLARSAHQAEELRAKYRLEAPIFHVRSKALDALSLMSNSTAVFSGGGTMTREAALLGLNVYSVFGGRIGAGDEYLVSQKRLRILKNPTEIEELTFANGTRNKHIPEDKNKVASFISDEIFRFAARG